MQESDSLNIKNWQKKLILILLVVIIPAIFFFLLELGLNIADFGYSSDFFKKRKIKNTLYYTDNMKFSWRFFPREVARTAAHFKIPIQKTKETKRILVLGASAAMGDPAPAYGFSRMLGKILQNRHPDISFEVTNLSMAAINSNAVLPIMRDCKKTKPDLVIIYLGNNEVIGPYGPGTIFKPFSSSLGIIRTNIFLRSTKTGQLIDKAKGYLAGNKKKREKWGGLDMFLDHRIRTSDKQMESVYNYFSENLRDISEIASNMGSKLILSTVATNLKDCSPFASLHKKDISTTEQSKWDKYFDKARQLEATEKYHQAIQNYIKALKIDDQYAELHFRLARCYYNLSDYSKARAHYIKARDYDALQFRATSKINNIIKKVNKKQNSENIFLLHANEKFQQEAANGLPGNSLFYDHVHMNFAGNYVIASDLSQKIEEIYNLKTKRKILTKDSLAKILAFSNWDQYRINNYLYDRLTSPAFQNQIYQEERVEKLKKTIAQQYRAFQDKDNINKTLNIYKNAIQLNNNDWFLIRNYGRFLFQGANKPYQAIEKFRLFLEEYPYDQVSYKNIGLAYAREGYLDLGTKYLKESIRRQPSYRSAELSLARIYESFGKYEKAIDQFIKAGIDKGRLARTYNKYGESLVEKDSLEKGAMQLKIALEYDPKLEKAYINLVNLYAQKQFSDSTEYYLTKLIRNSPHSIKGHLKFANLLEKKGEFQEAIEHYKKALQIDSNQPEIENAIGVIYISHLKKYEKGIEHFQKALTQRPDFAAARNNLAGALGHLGEYEKMVHQLEKAVEQNPDNPQMHNNLGGALLKQGKIDEAIDHFRKALDLKPDYQSAKRNLEYALSQNNN